MDRYCIVARNDPKIKGMDVWLGLDWRWWGNRANAAAWTLEDASKNLRKALIPDGHLEPVLVRLVACQHCNGTGEEAV